MNLVEALRAGEPVIIPTDTVYGLAATADDPNALERLYRLKGRDANRPSALVAPNVESLLAAVPELDEAVLRRLLPGPYTLIVRNPARRFPWLCGDTPEKIGVRVPELAEAARRALEEAGPVVATSANAPGGPDPARVEDVPLELRAAAAFVLDAGELPGTPSTVLDLTGTQPKVLRAGAGRSIPVMSIAQETFQHLTTTGLADVDPDVSALLAKELERQRGQIELIASENFTWPSILEAVGSVPTNKYAEGYPGKRYYGGCEVIDEIEQLAIDRAKELFGADHANVQPHAGAQTNMAVYFAVLQPGDTILSLRLDHGGHLTHGLKVNFSGKLYTIVGYGVSRDTMTVDYDEVLGLAKEHRPKLIICGGSAYPRTVETDKFREIADEVGALLLCDMAHFAGLVAAGLHPNPVEHADFVTSTTHKTLAGPRSGFILCRDEYAQAVDRAVFPGIQGGPLEHTIAAKATCFKIAMTEAFREYQRQIRANADVLSETLQEGGLEILTGGTDTHLMQVDLRNSEWTGKAAEERLHDVHITVNRNTVPFDERPPTVASGIRIGTPAMTMRGFDEEDFRETGRIIVAALDESPDLQALRARVDTLTAKRPLYPGFRGYTRYA